ncbi:hypothetical protein BVY02_02155, partial [bacterium J17]
SASRVGRGCTKLSRELFPPAVLFLALVLQLFVRVSIIRQSYNIEELRQASLKHDTVVRELSLELAKQKRPSVLLARATYELGMGPLSTDQVRSIVK